MSELSTELPFKAKLHGEAFVYFTIVINGPRKVLELSVNFCEDLVEMQMPPARFHSIDATLSDIGGKHRAEAIHLN